MINYQSLETLSKPEETLDETFTRLYQDIGAVGLSHFLRCNRQAIYSRYHFITHYKAKRKNGHIVKKERNFPYLKYLRLLLAEIRREAIENGDRLNEKQFKVWLGTLEGQHLLRQFSLAREGSWAIRDDMEGM